MNNQKINIEILDRFINNRCSPEELKLVISWFRDPGSEKELKNRIKEDWKDVYKSEKRTTLDFERLLDRIHHRLNIIAHDHYITGKSEGTKRTDFIRGLYNRFSKIAAILLIPFFLASLWYFTHDDRVFPEDVKTIYSEVYSTYGSKTKLELPDGSTVWLNDGSTLKFPQRFSGKTRTVYLTGEAYFDIIKKPDKSFIVKTSEFDIKVLGTIFNVMAYPEDNTIETTVETGKVILEKPAAKRRVINIAELEPNQRAVFDKKTSKLYTNIVNTEKYTSWRKGNLILRDDPMDDVVRRLKRWYNVDIELLDPELADFTYSATIIDETLLQVLDYLKIITPIEYTCSKREKMPDGTLTKQKIEITIRPGFQEKQKLY